MGRWKKLGLGALALLGLGAAGVAGLVGYAVATADARLAHPDTPYPSITASADPDVIERGRYLVHGPAHCSQCHSGDDREHPELIATSPLDGGLAFHLGPIGSTYAPNLTSDPETGIGGLTDAEIARAVRTGVTSDGTLSIFMRYSAANPSDEDLTAIVSYLRATAPLRNPVPKGSWTMLGKIVLTYAFPPMSPREGAPAHAAASEAPSVERGAYIAEQIANCTTCHTAMDPTTLEFVGPKGGGSLPEPSHGADSDKEFVAPNLTSHATGVTGQLSEDAFVARLRGGRVHVSSIMPWENFAVTSEADLRSVYRYLRTLPPIDNDVGPTRRDIGWTRPSE